VSEYQVQTYIHRTGQFSWFICSVFTPAWFSNFSKFSDSRVEIQWNRWSAHRSNWNKQYCKTDRAKDQMALSRHYSENHGIINKPPLHQAYTVTFVEQPSCHSLDICENKWYHLIDAQINIQNMILPHVK